MLQQPPNNTPLAEKGIAAPLYLRFFTDATSEINALPGVQVSHSVITKTAANTPYTIGATDELVLINAAAGGVTVLLPATVTPRVIIIKKIDSSGNAVTISGNSNNIDGGATASLAAQWNAKTIQGGATQWYITASV